MIKTRFSIVSHTNALIFSFNNSPTFWSRSIKMIDSVTTSITKDDIENTKALDK